MEENIPDVLSDQIDDPNLPDGGSIGSLDCANVDYDDPHLYRPHAFALRHGDNGAQVAYGELHWRVDTFTLEFKTSTGSGVSVTVDDHANHSHAPHDDHSHADHADHTDHSHSSHTTSNHQHTHAHIHNITDHTHNLGSGSGSTGSMDGSVTTGPAVPETTGAQGSETLNHSGVKTTSSSGSSGYSDPSSGILGHSDHSGVTTTSHGAPAPTSGILKHSGVTTLDGNGQGTSSSASDSTTGVLSHNVTVSGGLNSIIYCSGAGQSAINNITQQVPKINEKDGDAMDSKLDGVHTFHQLDGYGEVYLCWEVDFEESPDVQKCWVQIGVPVGSVTGPITVGTDTTGRLAQPPDPEYAVSTYHVHIGTVNLNERVVQKISSDVSWQPIVMDRVRA